MNIKKILVPTDFSEASTDVIAAAIKLAGHWGVDEVVVMHVVTLHEYDPHSPEQHFPDVDEIKKQAAAKMMSHLIQRFKTSKISLQCVETRAVAPGAEIVKYAAEQSIDMILMATHGRRGFSHLLLGSVADEVVRTAACPVLIVKQPDVELDHLERVLVPIDFSDSSEKLVNLAAEITGQFSHATLQLLHVVEEPVYPSFYMDGAVMMNDWVEEVEQRAKKRMETLVTNLPAKCEVKTYVERGRVASTICDFAISNKSQLIIMPTHGLTGLRRMLLGSVTEEVVRYAECSILTWRGFE